MTLLKKIRSALPSTAALFFPLSFVVIIGYFLIPYLKPYLKEVIAFGLLTVALSSLTFLTKNHKRQRILQILVLVVLAILAFIKLSFYYHYGVQLSASALYVIFETNGAEASDFLTNYFDGAIIGLLILFILGIIVSSFVKPYAAISRIHWKLLALAICIGSLGLISFKFSEENILLKSVSSYKDYQQTKALLKDQLAQKRTEYFKEISSKDGNQTYVFIIGESTSRWHMQLYGYPRKTNPMLLEIADELLVFDSVIAPNVHTILSLDKVLTFSNQQQPNKPKNASVIQMANAAGFTTYFISNQRPVGIHESIPTIIGSAAEHIYYTATDDYGDINYDEKVIPVLDQVLQEAPSKKIIFIQLIGTHLGYEKRYPETYNVFSGTDYPSTYKHKKAIKFTNSYDNAVRYNDEIVHDIITRIRKTENVSLVNYFSDHGDEVFDTMDFVGHNEYHGTRPMYEVPFMLWTSKAYRAQDNGFTWSSNITDRRYNLEDYIYTFADLCHINFTENDLSRSIVDSTYKKRARIVKNGVDYDQQ